MNEDIQDFAFAIYRAPQIYALAIDGHEHFVQVLPIVRSRACFPQFSSISLPKLQSPAPDSLKGNINATFSQQIFDISIAERKPEIQPDRMLNDQWREPVSVIGGFLHAKTILDRQHRGHSVNVTTPIRQFGEQFSLHRLALEHA